MQKPNGTDEHNALEEIGAWLRDRLPQLIAENEVPGAGVAVLSGEQAVETAVGVLSTATGVDVTVDSLFQIGSITKLVTATLIMQLVDEGRLDLDVPVQAVLPEFQVADGDATRRITPRHLLSHSAGFEGDIFTDTGKGDDCLEKYVELLRDVPQLFEPGTMFSYNNAGFCILGRIVEVLREAPFDACVRQHRFAPLGMMHTANDPYEAIIHRTAVGHVEAGPGGLLEPTPVWALARSNAPAGSMLAMRPSDLLTFTQMHLAAGRGPDGAQLLAPATVGAMQEPQVRQPDIAQGAAWGLGWELFDLPGGTVIGHDGNTIGQSAFLRLVPERDVAVAVVTNGGRSRHVYREVVGRVLEELAGITLPDPPTPNLQARVTQASRYIGTYDKSAKDHWMSDVLTCGI